MACDNLPTGRGLLPAAGHKGDTDNLKMPLARMSVVSSHAPPQLAWAALSWFRTSSVWHSLRASQEGSTQLAAAACPAACPQLRAAETQLHTAVAAPGLIPSLALAQLRAQLKARLQIAGQTQHKQPVGSGCPPCSYSPARPVLPLPLAAEQNHRVQCTRARNIITHTHTLS